MFIEIPASKNPLLNKKLVQGVGVNDADYQIHPSVNGKKEMCPYYRKWSDMIKRCYSEKALALNPSYKDCSVCDEWLLFSAFKSWMVKQDWQDKDLDKDIMVQGNKIYSPVTCLFVDPDVNMLLTRGNSIKRDLPIGVSFDKQRGKYQAKHKRNGKTKMLGRYGTAEEAHEVYKKFKYKLIKEVALLQSEPLRTALLNYVIR